MNGLRNLVSASTLLAIAGAALGQVTAGSFSPEAVEDYEGTGGGRVEISSLFGGLVPVVPGSVTHNSVNAGDWIDFRGGSPIVPSSGGIFGVGFGLGGFTLDFTGVGGILGFRGMACAAGIGADTIEFFDMSGSPMSGTYTDPDGFGPGDGTMEAFSFVSSVAIGSIRLSGPETAYDDLGFSTAALLLAGGFPITPIGPATLETGSGEIAAYGDGTATPFGLSIDFGELTSGVGATFQTITTGEELDPTLAIDFKSATSTNRLLFRNNPLTSDEAVLDVISDDPAFERFDVRVFRDGQLVHVFEDQASGTVAFADPDEGRLFDWLRRVFGGKPPAGPTPPKPSACVLCVKKTIKILGLPVFSRTHYKVSAQAIVRKTDGGGGFLGDEIEIVGRTSSPDGEPLTAIDFVMTGGAGLVVDVDAMNPIVVIGDAETNPRALAADLSTQIGVSVLAMKEGGVRFMEATDLTGDGLADLRIVPVESTTGLSPGDGVRMELGEVKSASVGVKVVTPTPQVCLGPCWREATGRGRTIGKMTYDPWPRDRRFIGLEPSFADVGSETFTVEIFDIMGSQVFAASGFQGFVGGTNHWPDAIGAVGGPEPLMTSTYPAGTIIHMGDGIQLPVHEIRVLAEGAVDVGLIGSLEINAINMDELLLFDPVTELAAPCRVDLDGDGVLDIFDFLAFGNEFDAGCP